MSKIAGHYEITWRAIQELKSVYPMDIFILDFAVTPLIGSITQSQIALGIDLAPWGYKSRTAINSLAAGGYTTACWAKSADAMCSDVWNPASGAVCQDLADTYECKHTSDKPEDQAAHFMRASGPNIDGKDVVAAYGNAVKLIEKNAQLAADQLTDNLFHFNDWSDWPGPESGYLTAGRASMYLGRALHALQDSFSPSHVERLAGSPGAISYIEVYSSQDKGKHSDEDKAWYNSEKNDFSALGRLAIDACKELIRMTIRMVSPVSWLEVPYLRGGPTWDSFQKTWLAFKPRSTGFDTSLPILNLSELL